MNLFLGCGASDSGREFTYPALSGLNFKKTDQGH
jgi:hypothetical protein